MDNEVAKVTVAEMVVGRMNLQYQDKKTGDIRDEGATKPEVIMRQLCTRSGQVCSVSQYSVPQNSVCQYSYDTTQYDSTRYQTCGDQESVSLHCCDEGG